MIPNAAYVQALLWYMTGNQAYANNAIDIMNTYAANFRGYAGTTGLRVPVALTAPTDRCNPVGRREVAACCGDHPLRQDQQWRRLGLERGEYQSLLHPAAEGLPAGHSERLGPQR